MSAVVLPAMAIAVAYASPADYDADTDSAVRGEEDCSEVRVRAGLTLDTPGYQAVAI